MLKYLAYECRYNACTVDFFLWILRKFLSNKLVYVQCTLYEHILTAMIFFRTLWLIIEKKKNNTKVLNT